MTKIVYNACYGGFGLSISQNSFMAEAKGIKLYFDKTYSLYSYYLVPPEEYNKIRAKEGMLSPARYDESNAMIFSQNEIERSDPILVQVVEELGKKANGSYAKLRIANIPAGTAYRIDEYDGYESVMTSSDYDWKIA